MNDQFDEVGQIIAYESGELDDEGTIALFQHLIDNGNAWRFQGHYGRTAMALIEAGHCARKPNFTYHKFTFQNKPDPQPKTAKGLWTVAECIKYIEGCGWKLTSRANGVYIFRKDNPDYMPRTFTFTLAELRHAKNNGW